MKYDTIKAAFSQEKQIKNEKDAVFSVLNGDHIFEKDAILAYFRGTKEEKRSCRCATPAKIQRCRRLRRLLSKNKKWAINEKPGGGRR